MLGTFKIFQREWVPVDPKRDNHRLDRLKPMPLLPPAIYPLRRYPGAAVGAARRPRLSRMADRAQQVRQRRLPHALEDPLVDELVEATIAKGVGAVVAQTPRAAIDCNRGEDEIDPTVVRSGPIASLSPRARGDWGSCRAERQPMGRFGGSRSRRSELEERLTQAHRPYHRAIEDALGQLLDRFGCALLLDCHSMPPPDSGRRSSSATATARARRRGSPRKR